MFSKKGFSALIVTSVKIGVEKSFKNQGNWIPADHAV
jgi:hypothetical protein